MCENSLKMGDILLNELKKNKKDYIKEVRGKGLFTAVEFEENAKVDHPEEDLYERCEGGKY